MLGHPLGRDTQAFVLSHTHALKPNLVQWMCDTVCSVSLGNLHSSLMGGKICEATTLQLMFP